MAKLKTQDKPAAAIAAAIETIDTGHTDDSGKFTGQFALMGRALHAAISIAPLTSEILNGIHEHTNALAAKKRLATQYNDLIHAIANGRESDDEIREAKKELHAKLNKAIENGTSIDDLKKILD